MLHLHVTPHALFSAFLKIGSDSGPPPASWTGLGGLGDGCIPLN